MDMASKAVRKKVALGHLLLPIALTLLCAAPVSSAVSPPDFSPNPQVSWIASPGGLKPAGNGPGPLRDDPKHPTISNDDFRLTGKQPTFPVADLSNPILQPWVRDIVRKHNEQVLAGKGGYGLRQSCWPVGLTIFLTVPVFRPIFIVQSPKEVVMTWQLDAQSRHIHDHTRRSQSHEARRHSSLPRGPCGCGQTLNRLIAFEYFDLSQPQQRISGLRRLP